MQRSAFKYGVVGLFLVSASVWLGACAETVVFSDAAPPEAAAEPGDASAPASAVDGSTTTPRADVPAALPQAPADSGVTRLGGGAVVGPMPFCTSGACPGRVCCELRRACLPLGTACPEETNSAEPRPCRTNVDCRATEYCAWTNCAPPGVCTPRPTDCTTSAPVCGCDGDTYSNPCAAITAGTSTRAQGECPPPPPPRDCRNGYSCGPFERCCRAGFNYYSCWPSSCLGCCAYD